MYIGDMGRLFDSLTSLLLASSEALQMVVASNGLVPVWLPESADEAGWRFQIWLSCGVSTAG